jgi:signal transduction histidine kinase
MDESATNEGISPRWYQSLYWRISIGFVVFLTLVLSVHIAFIVWMVDRAAGPMPGGSAYKFAKMVADDVGSGLARHPQLDLQQHVRRRYAQVPHPFFLLMTDGRLVSSAAPPEPSLMQFMGNELRRRVQLQLPPEPIRPYIGRASIVVDGNVVGLVTVPPRAPLMVILGRFAPRLAISGLVVLTVGTVLAATLIVRSPRRRLNALQEATRRVAAGNLSVRAPEEGADEIAALARAFNTMAVELGLRAEQLRAADQARRQLLADMCHELSTPLTAIRGYVEILLMKDVSFDSSAGEGYLGIIEQETHRMQRRIADLLDLARLEAGGGILAIQPVSVAQLFRYVVAMHESDCARKQIVLTTAAEPGAETVIGDQDRLEQVLQNLTANAIRHSPRDGRIELRAAARKTSVEITVSDTGEGIPPEHLPRVFDRFYKVDSARADRSGSGLGLSIAKAITERHGGAISVTSRPGETIFQVKLPLPDSKHVALEDPHPPEAYATSLPSPVWSTGWSLAQGSNATAALGAGPRPRTAE